MRYYSITLWLLFAWGCNLSAQTEAGYNHTCEDGIAAQYLLYKYFNRMYLSAEELEARIAPNGLIITCDSTLHPDGYILKKAGGMVTILGGVRKGCTYGAIRLLELLGCTCRAPDAQLVPYLVAPALADTLIESSPANDVRIINLYLPHDQDYLDWRKLHTIEEIYPENYFVHTFHRLVPREIYFQSHPEYFALVNGRRTFDQICPSHPEVRTLVVEQLKEEMAKQPEKHVWSVSQNDNFSYCQCRRCKKIIRTEKSPSGPIISLVNEVAAQFPDKIISTLAYQYSRKAPAHVQPAPNVEVMLCSIELYRHTSIPDNSEAADFRNDLEAWGRIANHLFLWDYTINFDHSLAPFPNLHTLGPNIRYFTDHHVNAIFEQSNTSVGYEFSELKAYLNSEFMWNPAADESSLINAFCHNYYGKAAPMILSYIQLLEQEKQMTQTRLWIYEHPAVHRNGLFSQERMRQYAQLFDAAELAVSNDSVALCRVQKARLPLLYVQLEIATQELFGERGWYTLQGDEAIPNTSMWSVLKRFEETCAAHDVPSVNESGLTPGVYIASLKRMIELHMDNNAAFNRPVQATVAPANTYAEGNLGLLTNGVQGASDFHVQWLGWFGKNTSLSLALDSTTNGATVSLNSLWNGKSWILHPKKVSCFVSNDGQNYREVGTIVVEGNQAYEDVIREYLFEAKGTFQFVRIDVEGTGTLFDWHPSAGEPSWFFLDEIKVLRH